jgi:hypothetical protein
LYSLARHLRQCGESAEKVYAATEGFAAAKDGS